MGREAIRSLPGQRTPGGPFDPDRCHVDGSTGCTAADLPLIQRAASGVGAGLANACAACFAP